MKVFILFECDWGWEGYDTLIGVFSSVEKAKLHAENNWDQEWNWEEKSDHIEHVSRKNSFTGYPANGFEIREYTIDGVWRG